MTFCILHYIYKEFFGGYWIEENTYELTIDKRWFVRKIKWNGEKSTMKEREVSGRTTDHYY